MRLKKLFIFILILFFCNFSIAQTIVVINLQSLIDNNNLYIKKIKEIEINKKKHFKNFEKKELELEKILLEIEESKLILNENELNTKINNYNEQLTNYKILVEEFNFHYENQVIKIREIILKEIIVILEKYAIENKIDLILDSNSYLIASNSIDVTRDIEVELEKINLNFENKNFEKN